MARIGRMLVFVDHKLRRVDDTLWAQDAFWLYVRGVADAARQVTYVARVDPAPGAGSYRCGPPDFSLVELPYYASLYRLPLKLPQLTSGILALWKAVGAADVVVLGVPNPIAVAIAAIARVRGVPRVLLDRQDLLPRVKLRAPGVARTLTLAITRLLVAWTARQSRGALTLTVGDHLHDRYYARGGDPRTMLVSLIREEQLTLRQPRAEPPTGPHRWLWVGRVEDDKGLTVLIEAFARYLRGGELDDRREARLDLVGTGPATTAMKARAAQLGVGDRVQFHGYVPYGPALLALYDRAGVFVLPSNESEGFPQVLFESFAVGLPVVATAVAGIPQSLCDGEETLLVPPRSAVALSNAVERVLSDAALYSRLSAGGYRFVRRHTYEAQVQKFVNQVEAHLNGASVSL